MLRAKKNAIRSFILKVLTKDQAYAVDDVIDALHEGLGLPLADEEVSTVLGEMVEDGDVSYLDPKVIVVEISPEDEAEAVPTVNPTANPFVARKHELFALFSMIVDSCAKTYDERPDLTPLNLKITLQGVPHRETDPGKVVASADLPASARLSLDPARGYRVPPTAR